MTTTNEKNRHLVDRYSDVREEMRALKLKADMLRDEILSSGDEALKGDEFLANILDGKVTIPDTQAIIKKFGREAIEPFLRVTHYQKITLRRIK